jgi:uncharacterized protein involved in response to NO
MLALRRARMAAAPPFLRGGFRPFFLAGAVWAAIALFVWLLSLASVVDLPTAFTPLAWHRHEMLFGFVGAVIAGFLLTAIPNWTGRLPIAGVPLASLFMLWLAARLLVLFSRSAGIIPAAIIDSGFYLVLAGLAAREVLFARTRNLPIVLLVLLFGAANALDYAAAAGLLGDEMVGMRAGISLVVLMISLIGGRIIPSFTRNWLAKQGRRHSPPTQPNSFDLTTIAVTALALILWTLARFEAVAPAVFMVAAVLQAARLLRWRGWRAWRDPLVLILHVGYAWVPIGLGLLGASLGNGSVPLSGAIHALTAGAMATMILAVMSRASLGHTGRDLKAATGTVVAYVLVTAGALLRVGASLNWVDYRIGVNVAGALWIAAFLLFLATYGPILLGPRIDEPR